MCKRLRTTRCDARWPHAKTRPGCYRSSRPPSSETRAKTQQCRCMDRTLALTTHDDVEFGVDVNEPSVTVNYGQSGDPLSDKLVQGLYDRRLALSHFDVAVGPDTELTDALVEVGRARKVMDLKTQAQSLKPLTKMSSWLEAISTSPKPTSFVSNFPHGQAASNDLTK